MQAIHTKFIPPTNTRCSRIKARCDRGSIMVPYNTQGDTDPHRYAVECLIAKFCDEDEKRDGTPKNENPWARAFISGELPDGTQTHVFTR